LVMIDIYQCIAQDSAKLLWHDSSCGAKLF
jgi:hypothetical protein